MESGPASSDGVALRFKLAGDAREITRVRYESEQGTAGVWRVWATDDADASALRAAHCAPVDDSGEGVSQLVWGGAHGLLLEHEGTGERVREAYLLLAVGSDAG